MILSLLMVLSLTTVHSFAADTTYESKTVGYSEDLIDHTLTQAEVDALPRLSDFIKPKDGTKGYTSFVADDYTLTYSQGYKLYQKYRIVDYTDMVALSVLGFYEGNKYVDNISTYYLANDIDMSAVKEWRAIADNTGAANGNSANPYFCGTFDGRGFAIKNLKVEGTDENGLVNISLFGCIKGATIKNLVIDASCSFTYKGTNSMARTASLVAFGNTNGTYNYWKISNVQNNANITATVGAVGGFMADSGAQWSSWFGGFTNCTNNGNVTATGDVTHAGGIIGYVARSHAEIQACVNNGEVTATGYGGGIAAGITPTYYYRIYDCQNNGTVKALYAGGILGALEVNSTCIQRCTNTGRIVTVNSENGIARQIYGFETQRFPKGNITDNVESGTVDAIDVVRILGYQKTLHTEKKEDGKEYRSVRVVGILPATEEELSQYEYVGLSIIANYVVSETLVIKTVDSKLTVVYETLGTMNGAGGLGKKDGWYYFAVVLKDIPADIEAVELELTPYSKLTASEKITYGYAKTVTVTVREYTDVELNISDPTVVIQPGTYEDYGWGYYQFVRILPTVGGGQYIYWSMANDANTKEEEVTKEGQSQAVSDDDGTTWRERVYTDIPISDLRLSDGSYLTGLGGGSSSVKEWMTKYSNALIQHPGVDLSNHHLYFAEDINDFDRSLKGTSVDPQTGETTTFDVTVNWPYAPMAAFTVDGTTYVTDFGMAFGMGSPANIISRNGTLYLCIYSRGFDSSAETRESAVFKYSDCMNVYVFKSTDDARTWDYVSQVSVNDEVYTRGIEYQNAGKGVFEGFNEPMMEVMPDGSIVMLMRSGSENQPSYIVRSTDGCQTWSDPVVFDEVGVKPQILTLECGVTIASYGREGLYVRATADMSGLEWEDPIRIALTGETLSSESLAEDKRISDYYTCLFALDSKTVLMLYTDFYYPDDGGEPKKTILARIITVQDANE